MDKIPRPTLPPDVTIFAKDTDSVADDVTVVGIVVVVVVGVDFSPLRNSILVSLRNHCRKFEFLNSILDFFWWGKYSKK